MVSHTWKKDALQAAFTRERYVRKQASTNRVIMQQKRIEENLLIDDQNNMLNMLPAARTVNVKMIRHKFSREFTAETVSSHFPIIPFRGCTQHKHVMRL